MIQGKETPVAPASRIRPRLMIFARFDTGFGISINPSIPEGLVEQYIDLFNSFETNYKFKKT